MSGFKPANSNETFTNSIGMKFKPVSAGTYTRGGYHTPLPPELSADKPHLLNGDFDEHPAHQVTITQPFYLGLYQVTNIEYEYFAPDHRSIRGKLGFSNDDDEAVVFVDWHQATAFCRWLTEKENIPYRLPTEAEWEYACRAGSQTHYHTGNQLPDISHKNVRESWYPDPARSDGDSEVVPLTVGQTLANEWGFYDMHGNVEEWCSDWYGPYQEEAQTNPVGYAEGNYRVTRGGSHSTKLYYLRSANRSGAVPKDQHWLIGFRVTIGEFPSTEPRVISKLPLWATAVKQEAVKGERQDFDPDRPYFDSPKKYVQIPEGSIGPLFSNHNHVPAIVSCPNGDLLAIWYSCVSERGRELNVVGSRLRFGQQEWEPAETFWGVPDRNNHASALWCDEVGKIYHFNGLSVAATWGPLAMVMRTSEDNGATWSGPKLVHPEHTLRHMPIESVFRAQDESIVLVCDAVTGGNGGTALHISRDNGQTWVDPGEGQLTPTFETGQRGHWIAGIHASVVQVTDGRLMALGRGDTIEGKMPMSISEDMGQTWSYQPSQFPVVSGGQRCVLLRLKEGPIFLASFTGDRKDPAPMLITDASGQEREVRGMFAALSLDEGQTWPHIRLISDDGSGREIETMDGRLFTMSFDSAEPGGYLSVCQSADNLIHLITSQQHYAFNLAWLTTPGPSRSEVHPCHSH